MNQRRSLLLSIKKKQLLYLLMLASWLLPSAAKAQIVPDNTLGTESSVVTPNVTINGIESDRLDGGAIRGANLFHSFQEFNVGNGSAVYFANPAAISNIFARVTGSQVSHIFGTLGVLGNANLFLINPNGIVFGANARLDMRGSFIGSSADSVRFNNGFEFSAGSPDVPPLLTINIPIGLNFRENPGSIVNRSVATNSRNEIVGLSVSQGNTLGLIGGNVTLDGGKLLAPKGRIELGSVGDRSQVSLAPTDMGWKFGYSEVSNFQDIQLIQGATVDVSGDGGGQIQIQGRRVSLQEGSRVTSVSKGSQPGGSLTISATESVRLIGTGTDEFEETFINGSLDGNLTPFVVETGLFTGTFLESAGGDIIIDTSELVLMDGAVIFSSTSGSGEAGDMDIRATSRVAAIGSGLLNIALVESTGAGGDISVDTEHLIVRDGGLISTVTLGSYPGGDVNLNASESIEVLGTSAITSNSADITGIFANSIGGNADAGDINIETRRLTIREGAQIATGSGIDPRSNTIVTGGKAGNIRIQADEQVEVTGRSADRSSSSLIGTETFSEALAGDLHISTETLIVSDGAFLSVATFGSGAGGNLHIRASETVELMGTGFENLQEKFLQGSLEGTLSPTDRATGLFAGTAGAGRSGEIVINTPLLLLRDGAVVSSSTFGSGAAGNITLNASQKVEMIGSSLLTIAQLNTTGTAGHITIETPQLIIRDGSLITATTLGTGAGGNIDVSASESIELLNAPAGALATTGITSNSLFGTGQVGSITIETRQLIIRDGGSINTTSGGITGTGIVSVGGEGGNLQIDASQMVELTGTSTDSVRSSSISTDTLTSSTAGHLTVNTGKLIVRDGARISVSSEGLGNAGNLELAANSIRLDNGEINAATDSGAGGSLTLRSQEIQLRRGSRITTNAGNTDGGNIAIDTNTLVALENSDITANALQGRGGRVTVNARGIFGTQFRNQQTPSSDITATSKLGPEFDGMVAVSTPEAEPSIGLVNLPIQAIDAADLIAQDPCQQGRDSSFTISGHGGLPPDPHRVRVTPVARIGWVDPLPVQAVAEEQMESRQEERTTNRMIPARGWIFQENGDVLLIGYDPTGRTAQRHRQNPLTCSSQKIGE